MTQERLPCEVNSRATSTTSATSMPAAAAYSSIVRSPKRSLRSANTITTRVGLPFTSTTLSTSRSAGPSSSSAATSSPPANTNRASSASPPSPVRPSSFAVTTGLFGRSTATRCVASDQVGSPKAAAANLEGARR